MKLVGSFLLCATFHVSAMAAGREVAITIDDLPRGGDSAARDRATVRVMTERLLAPFREQRMPEHRERVLREYVPYMKSVVAFFETRSVEVVGREFPQVLLLHANQLNADVMPELLAMFRRRGYTFVSLDHALEDDAYDLPKGYVGRGGFSWIHRWSLTKGMPPRGEPEPAAWVREAWAAR